MATAINVNEKKHACMHLQSCLSSDLIVVYVWSETAIVSLCHHVQWQRSYRCVFFDSDRIAVPSCALAAIVSLCIFLTAIVSLCHHVHWQRSYRCVDACSDSDRIAV